MKLHIADNISLPIDAVTQTIVIYGGKGMGKTNLLTVLAEELAAAGQRFSIIDPMGVFWGLRHSSDGKGPGIELLILGGRHGDIPIEPTGGGVVADLVVDETVNVLIDISSRPDGKSWSKGERIRFVTDYFTRLYERQGEKRRPILQILDEAARFVPQMMHKGDLKIAECLGAIEQVVEEGRNVGIGIALAAQRSARLNKSVAELAECMVAFRTIGPNSVAAITDWLGEHVSKDRWKEIVEQLRSLPRGNALMVSPGWLEFEDIARIRRRNTFDSSSTPKLGKQVQASGRGAKPDLDRYYARMKETIERAAADDPKTLRAQIRQLTAELAAARAKAPELSKEQLDALVKQGIEKSTARTVAEIKKRWLAPAASAMRKAIDLLTAGIPEGELQFTLELPLPESAEKITGHQAKPAAGRRHVEKAAPGAGDSKLAGAEQKILDAIAELHALGVEKAPRVQVAFMAGYTNLNSKGFVNGIGRLRNTHGFIEYGGDGTIWLTDTGAAAATHINSPADEVELQDRLIRMLGGSSAAIVRALVNVYPSAMSREDLAAAAGYTNLNSKGFVNSIGRLRTLGFIDYPERGSVIASKLLFFGRRAA